MVMVWECEWEWIPCYLFARMTSWSFCFVATAFKKKWPNPCSTEATSATTLLSSSTCFAPSVPKIQKIIGTMVVIEAKCCKGHTRILEEPTDRAIDVCGDARCNSPGHCAKYGAYNLVELSSKKVLTVELVQEGLCPICQESGGGGMLCCAAIIHEACLVDSVWTGQHVACPYTMPIVQEVIMRMLDIYPEEREPLEVALRNITLRRQDTRRTGNIAMEEAHNSFTVASGLGPNLANHGPHSRDFSAMKKKNKHGGA
ncbi:hypothetical protein ACROYT_G015038 [Oculina patagonica]